MAVIIFTVLVAVLFAVALILGFTRNLGKSILRLISVVIAFILTAIITASIAKPTSIAEGLSEAVVNVAGSNEKIAALLSSQADSVSAVYEFLIAALSPFIFLAVFMFINFILWIVFAIVSSKLKFLDKKGVGYKLGSIGINLVVCFIIVSAITTPIAFVSDGVDKVSKSVELPAGVTENLNLNDSAVFNVFAFLSKETVIPSLTKVESPRGSTSTVTDSLPVFIDVVKGISSISIENGKSFYTLADILSKDRYVDEVLGSILADIPKHKDELGTIIGSDILGDENSTVTQKAMDILANTTEASASFKLLGNVFTMAAVLTSPTEQTSTEDIETMFKNITEKDSEMLAELIDTDVMEEISSELPEVAEAYVDVINKIATGIASINSDTSLSESARDEAIKNEAAAFSSLASFVNNAGESSEEPDYTEIVGNIASSTVLSDIICEATDNGEKTNPFNIPEGIDTDVISNALKENGISESDEFYKSFIALFPVN